MHQRTASGSAAWAVGLVLVVSACSPGAGAGASGASTPASLTILGAASLTGALEAAKTASAKVDPATPLTISADSSSALETQIEQGAPADVFLSADTTNPKKLVDEGLAEGAAVTFATNRRTAIVPTANTARIGSPVDLARTGIRIVAAGDEVPITKYANQLLDNLAKEPGYPADFVAKVTANIVSREDNVKAVVAKVELGEADAGIVYVTDAKASSKVTMIPVPDAPNVPATYAGVVVKASRNATAARAFLDWFAGPEGGAILASFGFLPPS
jgi:molybdate transport system substrate-binding protein